MADDGDRASIDDVRDPEFNRRVDLVAHLGRTMLGIGVLVAAWTTSLGDGDEVPFTIFMVLVFFPLSPIDFHLTQRFGDERWFQHLVAAGHCISVFGIAWIAPSTRVLVLLAYVSMTVVFSMEGGQRTGFTVTAIGGILAAAAEALVPPDDRLPIVWLLGFGAASIFISVVVHQLTAERAAKAAQLRVVLAEEQRQREAVEAAARAKDRFVEATTHELRTPLAVVIGALQVLNSSSVLPERQRALLLERAISRAHDVDHIVSQVAAYTDIDSATRGDPEPTAVNHAVGVARAELARQLVDRTVDVTGGDATAWVCSRQFGLLLAILVENAAKYSDPDTPIRVDACVEGDEVVVRVVDQGRGIAAEDLEQVFEPFVQSGEMLPGTQGVGVGLTLARRYCERNDGTIAIESALGEGTTVTVRLPRAEVGDSSDESPATSSDPAAVPADASKPDRTGGDHPQATAV